MKKKDISVNTCFKLFFLVVHRRAFGSRQDGIAKCLAGSYKELGVAISFNINIFGNYIK